MQNGIVLEDIMFYAMPFGWLGELLKRWLIADRLEQVFDNSRDYLHNRW